VQQPLPVTFHKHSRPDLPKATSGSILLCTLNARYIHASLGLRYLYANMGALENCTDLIEFTINERISDIVEKLISHEPEILGFGVYIWNVRHTTELIALIKKLQPKIKIIIGGPEVSYEYNDTHIFKLCDHLICGQADQAFPDLCLELLQNKAVVPKVITATTPHVQSLKLPYRFYSEEDISHRVLYVEASRGCPFKCEFCLSALDKTAYPFEIENFLAQIDSLYTRGARQFKFVDRTFNLKTSTCSAILQFFLEKIDQNNNLFLHFEVIPDRLPEALKNLIEQFPPGSLQFEIGIQSFDEKVQQTISRKQNIENTITNLQWLHQKSNAHIHADLIFGLPGETEDSFAKGFDQLVALKPDEIQLGILKRLRGSPIVSKTDEYQMIYSDEAPYELLQNRDVSFSTLQRVKRFARYWDLIANSGRFKHTLPALLADQPYARFMELGDWIFASTGQTHKISYARLLAIVHSAASELGLVSSEDLYTTLSADSAANGDPHPPRWLDKRLASPANGLSMNVKKKTASEKNNAPTPSRQKRHLHYSQGNRLT